MTKKEKLLAKIEELKQEVEALGKKSERWEPNTCEKYAYVAAEGDSTWETTIYHPEKYEGDRKRMTNYNVFPTDWKLSPLIKAQKIQRAIFEGAMRRGAFKEFKKKEYNFCIVCGDGDWFVDELTHCHYPEVTYFTTREAAQETLEELLELGVLKL